MADSPGFRVHVTRTINYSYDEYFFTKDGVTDIESTLTETVEFRNPNATRTYTTADSVTFSEITD